MLGLETTDSDTQVWTVPRHALLLRRFFFSLMYYSLAMSVLFEVSDKCGVKLRPALFIYQLIRRLRQCGAMSAEPDALQAPSDATPEQPDNILVD